MQEPTPSIGKGDEITAAYLNQLAQLAASGKGTLPGSPGVYVSVKSRTANEPTALVNHQYTLLVPPVGGGGGAGYEIEVDWKSLHVRMPFGLVDPDQLPHLRFEPAAVVGDAVWQKQPLRAWGILHRLGAPDSTGERTYAVDLFGLVPSAGC